MITKEKAQELAKEFLDKANSRFKQELVGENEETLDRILRKYRTKVARHSWKMSQKWSKWDNSGPVLMPDYARIYYRKGKTEVVLMELPPQVRLMKFYSSLVNRETSTSPQPKDPKKIYHLSLALPYVVFIFKFINGQFNEVKCAFCDRALKRLEERPLRPYLPNINDSLKVCLGGELDRSQLIEGQLAQQIAFILDNFWHTAYSEDWSGHYWSNRAHFKDTDPRMASPQSWQEAGQTNSLFVIEDVNWLQHSQESFGDMVVKMFQDDSDNQKLQEDLYEGLTEAFFDDIKKDVNDNISKVSTKVSEQQINDFAEELLTKLNS